MSKSLKSNITKIIAALNVYLQKDTSKGYCPDTGNAYGICCNIDEIIDPEATITLPEASMWHETNKKIMETWHEFSGNALFPISTLKNTHPIGEYTDNIASETMRVGAYGAARERLCVFLIEEYTKMLENEDEIN